MRRSVGVSPCADVKIDHADLFLGRDGAQPDVILEKQTGDARPFHFLSRVRTNCEENNRARGVFFPAGENWQTKPAVLLVHGWNAEYCYRFQFPRLAKRLRRAGINTVTLELPYHLQRRPPPGNPVCDFISNDLQAMLQATRQSLEDIRAIRDWLGQNGCPKIGLWGFSLGAWLAGLSICADERFDFAVLLTPVVRVDRAIAELDFCEPIRRALHQNKVPLANLDLLWHRPKIARKKILIIESRHDVFLPPETVEELWRAWAEPELWRVDHGHISIMMSSSVMKRATGWIARTALS